MKKPVLVGFFALALASGWMILRSWGTAGLTASEIDLARDRTAAYFEQGDLDRARAVVAPLIEAADAAVEDLLRAAVIDYRDRSRRDPGPLFERLRDADPQNPALHYMLARTSLEEGEFERAGEHYRTTLRSEPGDLASQLGLGRVLNDLGQSAEAEKLLRGVVEAGVDRGGAWTVTAVHQLERMAQAAGRQIDAQRFHELYEQFTRLGYELVTPLQRDRGGLARVHPASPRGIDQGPMGPPPRFQREAALLPELAGARELFAHDLDGDGDVDFVAAGPLGLVCALREGAGYRVETVLEGPLEHVRAFDLGNDDSLDLLVCRGTELLLFEAASGADLLLQGARGWSLAPLELPSLPAPPADLIWTDFDHEGDLDLLLVGTFGARLLRNDGAAPRRDEQGQVQRGRFTDVSLEAGLPADVDLTWCDTEDLDNDQDVDLLLGGPSAVFLMDNLRAGRFVDVAGRVLGEGVGMARAPLVADFDGDGRADLFQPGEVGALWLQAADGRLRRQDSRQVMPSGAEALTADLDLDGTLDLLWAGDGGRIEGALAFGTPAEQRLEIEGLEGLGDTGGPWVACDVDQDLDLDLVLATDEGLVIYRCEGPVGGAARVTPLGLKDNRQAVGALVEVRTAGVYRRIYWRGDAQLVGCGSSPRIDVLRMTWPNGAVQTWLDVELTDQPFLDVEGKGLEQSTSLGGSCPFLYSWNGSTYEFISDVLGITPLGLPMAPGMLVPPDHDEYVLVRGDQLVAREGWLELQFTEELREVTYLDRIRLDVVDHPLGSEVYPNERFTFPPFPEHLIHGTRAPLAPTVATGSSGEDWTAALAAVDDVHSVPPSPYPRQFLGLAAPHWVELHFDPARTRAAEHLRLLFTGWFYWTDASVNMAAGRTDGIDFVPPILQVPGPDGGWIDAGPPVGFPAGKTKTMVIDVSDVLDREDPRVRVATTLCLYWDSIRLAVDDEQVPLRQASLEADSARLWSRGFSRPIATGREDLPERFEWDALAEYPRWNQHPGRYTRYGEVLELLGEVDDRFVILGSGDALTVRFDARALPPLETGWTRDYLVYLDGWAKDRDPNTLEALEVEPLPFHAMSGYPYGADEGFPWDEAHRAWDREWNTRPAHGWIPPLSPRREVLWVLR